MSLGLLEFFWPQPNTAWQDQSDGGITACAVAARTAAAIAVMAFGGDTLIQPPTVTNSHDPGQFECVVWLPPIIYQATVSAVPLTTVVLVNWQTLNPELFVRPFTEKPFQSFQPQGFIQSTFPDGWRGYQFDTRFARPFPAAAQQYAAEIERRAPTAVTVQGWWPCYPDLFAKPFPASSQRFADFQPQGFIASRFPDGWRTYQYDCAFARPFPAVAQQYACQVAERVPAAADVRGWWPYYPDLFRAPLSPAVQQWAAFQPAGFIASIFPDGWRGSTEYNFAKPFPAGGQQFLTFTGFPVPVAGTAGGGQFDSVIWRAPIVYQASAAAFPPIASVVTSPDGWRSVWDNNFAIRRSADTPASIVQPAAARTEGWRGFQFDTAFRSPLSAAQQPFGGFQPRGAIFTIFPDGWRGFQYDIAFRSPLSAALQPLGGFQLAGTIVTVFPDGWRSDWAISSNKKGIFNPENSTALTPAARAIFVPGELDYRFTKPGTVAADAPVVSAAAQSNAAVNWQALSPEIFGKSLPPALQQFFAYGPRSIPVAGTWGWAAHQFEYRFTAPYPVVDQQANHVPPAQSIPVAGTWGWLGFQWEARFRAPFPAALQQYLFGFLPTVSTLSNSKVNWQSLSPERFALAFPATLQQFDTIGLVPFTGPFAYGIPAGHGDWPRFLKEKKPRVQPIWDRRPEPAAPEAAPEVDLKVNPEAVPEDNVETLSSPFLTRVILPQGASAPPPTPYTAPVTEEISPDTTGSITPTERVFTPAEIATDDWIALQLLGLNVGTEERWDDDDIALALLGVTKDQVEDS